MGIQPENTVSCQKRTSAMILVDYWPLIVTGVLFLVIQWPVLRNWWHVWGENESYYSHGYLVPFISAFMIWVNRGRLMRADIGHSWLGLVLLLIFVPLHAIGLLMGLRVIYGVAFFLCIYGAVLMLLGWQITRITFIPILFLSTMMPLASWMIDSATARFQLISATVATKFLQLTSGYDVTQYGNTIYSSGLPGQTLLVGSPCSGLRLLISLITFSWFFIYVIRAAWWKKLILLCMSFPLSIFINSLRVTLIAYAGFLTGSEEAMHKFHDYSGYIGLLICFAILFGVAKLMKAADLSTGAPAPEEESRIKFWPKPVGKGVHFVVVMAVFIVTAALSSRLPSLYDLPKGQINRSNIPMKFGEWVGQDVPIDPGVEKELAKGDLLNRYYVDTVTTGRRVELFIDASLDISAFHDPHQCLPGGGSPVTNDKVVIINFSKPRAVKVRATILQAGNDFGRTLVIHWYMIGPNSYPTTQEMAQAIREAKMGDFWRIVRAPWELKRLQADIRSRQIIWYRFSTDSYDETKDEEFLKDFIREFVAHVPDFGK
ncbi:MAG: exosortase [Armatimonadetes bacterium]|nr:exosortase [Armatimonadota bacterium]